MIIPDTSIECPMPGYSIGVRNDLGSQIPPETMYTLGAPAAENIGLPAELETRLNKVIDSSQLASESMFVPIKADTVLGEDIESEPADTEKQDNEGIGGKTANMLMRHLLTKPIPGNSIQETQQTAAVKKSAQSYLPEQDVPVAKLQLTDKEDQAGKEIRNGNLKLVYDNSIP